MASWRLRVSQAPSAVTLLVSRNLGCISRRTRRFAPLSFALNFDLDAVDLQMQRPL